MQNNEVLPSWFNINYVQSQFTLMQHLFSHLITGFFHKFIRNFNQVSLQLIKPMFSTNKKNAL